jgi:tetratricopeptide (TPR) repeat protein
VTPGPRRGGLFLLLLAVAPAVAESPGADPVAALREGNRLFRAGRLEEAFAAFAAACDPRAPDPLLAYNLGATAHQLGRLPEAILWYRRAAAAGSTDRWLADNLDLARATLGTAPPRPPDPAAWAASHPVLLRLAAVAAAWAALALLAWGRAPAWPWGTLAVAAAALYAAAAIPWPVRPAVLLDDCAGRRAGTELWVRAEDDGWRIAGAGDAPCPAAAAVLVAP